MTEINEYRIKNFVDEKLPDIIKNMDSEYINDMLFLVVDRWQECFPEYDPIVAMVPKNDPEKCKWIMENIWKELTINREEYLKTHPFLKKYFSSE